MSAEAVCLDAEYEAHPIADRLPMMNVEQFRIHCDDIRQNGLVMPISVFEGKILDGRNRYKACKEVGIEPRFEPYVGETPMQFVWSMNGARRQFSKSQLAALAVAFLPELEAEAKKRQVESLMRGDQIPVRALMPQRENKHGSAVIAAAKLLGVGETYVKRAKTISIRSPELFQEILAGNICIDEARRVVAGSVPFEERKQIKRVGNVPKNERAKEISRLASFGADGPQIAQSLGISEELVSSIAKAEGIDFHKSKAHRVKTERVIVESVNTLAGIALGLQFIDLVSADFSVETVSGWLGSIKKSMVEIGRVRRALENIKRGEDK
jgi:hypothetical protein